jgi:hypothetical protein
VVKIEKQPALMGMKRLMFKWSLHRGMKRGESKKQLWDAVQSSGQRFHGRAKPGRHWKATEASSRGVPLLQCRRRKKRLGGPNRPAGLLGWKLKKIISE